MLDGGNGNDTASYENSNAAVNIDRGRDTASGGHAEGDDLNNIENVTGSDYNDTLIGNSGANILNGGGSDDTLTGGGGADRFELILDGVTDRVTDFSVSQGDKIRIDTADGTEDSYQDLGLGISGNNSITHLQYQGETVMTLSGIGASDVILGSFDTYFEVV